SSNNTSSKTDDRPADQTASAARPFQRLDGYLQVQRESFVRTSRRRKSQSSYLHRAVPARAGAGIREVSRRSQVESGSGDRRHTLYSLRSLRARVSGGLYRSRFHTTRGSRRREGE